jgi:hypothetical protein
MSQPLCVHFGSILLEKVFRGVERIFSEAPVRLSGNDVGGTHNQFDSTRGLRKVSVMHWITKNRFRRAHRRKFRSVHFGLFQQYRPIADIARPLLPRRCIVGNGQPWNTAQCRRANTTVRLSHSAKGVSARVADSTAGHHKHRPRHQSRPPTQG